MPGSTTLSFNCRGLKIPFYNNIVNLGLYSFPKTSSLIDQLSPINKEWGKINVLVNDFDYLTFINKSCKQPIKK
jgi:hypothetical protein